jgi:hypothetical protein
MKSATVFSPIAWEKGGINYWKQKAISNENTFKCECVCVCLFDKVIRFFFSQSVHMNKKKSSV